MSKDHWKLKKLVDSSINTQPLFVHDDSKIILVQGSIIKAVSAETGGLLSQVRNDFDVKFVVMHPTHNNQCIAVLQNNSLCSWDIDECSLTILGQLKGNVVGLHTSSIKTTSVFLIVNLNVGRCTTIVEFDLMRQVQLECYRYNGHCSNSCVGLRNGNCIFALQIQEDILFFAEDIDIKRMEFKVEKIATSMTFHPKDATFVVGDKSGRIHFFDIEESVKPTSVRHWHAHSVHCIGYDHNGDLFFSGGEENTVVIWNLNNGGKNFLPRLGGMILHFAPNHAGNAFVIVTENNTIRTFESSLTERWTIRGISASSNVNYDLETASELTGGLLFDPRSRSVVLSGAPGSASLQLFDVFKEMHLMDIDIGHRNPISRTQLSKLKPLIVDNVSFSQNGMQMVTTERRSLADGDETTTMKFWDYLPGRHTFCLNTRIDNPHESRITGVKFHPTGEYVVTASLDGHFKTWISVVSESPTQKGKSTKQWTGLSNGYWQDHKGLSSIDISEDGSFMALAYGPIITLWEPKTNRLRHTLSHPPPEYDLRFVQFIPKTSYVVGVSKSMVHVWNVVSLDVWWSSTAHNIKAFAVDNFSNEGNGLFAIAAEQGNGKKTNVMMFHADKHEPFEVIPLDSNISVHSMAFCPSQNASDSALMVLFENKTIQIIVRELFEDNELEENTFQTPKKSSFAEAFSKDSKLAQNSTISANLKSNLDELLDTPTHTLPQPSDVFDLFLQRKQ